MREEIKRLLKDIIVCIFFCLVIGVVVSVALHMDVWSSQKAFLYRLLAMTGFCSIALVVGCVVLYTKKKSFFGLDLSSSVLCVGISALFMALFFSLGPMTIERSYTIFSLADMSETPYMVYSAEEIKERFINRYINEANESQKRIDEQVYIGNMEQVDSGYRITDKGERLIKMMRFVEMIFPVPDESSIYPSRIGQSEES